MRRIFNLYRKFKHWFSESYWLKSSSYTVLSKFYRLLIGLISFIILVRLLPKASFGEWVLYISIITLIEIIRDGFLVNPLVKFVVEYKTKSPSEVPAVLTSTFFLNFVFAFLVFWLIFFLRTPISILLNSAILNNLLLIGAYKLLFTFPGSFCMAVQQANLQFKWVFWADFINRSVFVIILLYLYYFDVNMSLSQLAGLDLMVYLIGAIILVFSARSVMIFSPLVQRKVVLQVLGFAKYTLASNIGSMIFRNIDTWMLSSIISPAAVAINNTALRISNVGEVPSKSINAVIFPKIVEAFQSDGIQKIKSYYELSVSASLSYLLPLNILLWFFAEPIIIIIAGEQYIESAVILRIVLMTGLLTPFVRQFGIALEAINQPQKNTVFILFMSAMNVFYNYFLISKYGIIGAAYGTLLGVFTGWIVSIVYLRNRISISYMGILIQIFRNYHFAYIKIKNNLG